MINDDNLLCCLLPNKCNLYGRSLLVHIFNTTFYNVNFLLAIYILVTAMYNFWQMWNQYKKNILSDLVCQNDQTDFNNVNIFKNEDGISSKLKYPCQYTNIKDNLDMIDISQCHWNVINTCKNTKNQRPFKQKSTKSETKLNPCNCTTCEVTRDHCSKICSNQKGEIEDKHIIKRKCTNIDTSNLRNERFCVATFEKKHSIKGDTSKLSICDNSCWPLIKKIYNTKQ